MTLKEIKARLAEIDAELRRLPQKEQFTITKLNRERDALLQRAKKNFPQD